MSCGWKQTSKQTDTQSNAVAPGEILCILFIFLSTAMFSLCIHRSPMTVPSVYGEYTLSTTPYNSPAPYQCFLFSPPFSLWGLSSSITSTSPTKDITNHHRGRIVMFYLRGILGSCWLNQHIRKGDSNKSLIKPPREAKKRSPSFSSSNDNYLAPHWQTRKCRGRAKSPERVPP